MYCIRIGKTLALVALLSLGACSTGSNLFPPAGDHPFVVQSDPVGADVYVMGDRLGVTPLTISYKDVFPTLYPHQLEALYGKVTLKHAGCTDYTRTIDGKIASNGLHARLDCADMVTPPGAASPAGTVEQRLAEVKSLRDKGLITEDEAKQARQRILNGL